MLEITLSKLAVVMRPGRDTLINHCLSAPLAHVLFLLREDLFFGDSAGLSTALLSVMASAAASAADFGDRDFLDLRISLVRRTALETGAGSGLSTAEIESLGSGRNSATSLRGPTGWPNLDKSSLASS